MCDLLSFRTPTYGFNYVLVFKDVFSGFMKCYRLRDKTTKGVVKSLEDLVCSLGPLKQLTSDKGKEFDSDMLHDACKSISIEKRTSVPYQPQSQGNVERQNRVILEALRERLLQYGKTWAEHVPYVEYVYNTTPCSKTGVSPYLLFFGREQYIPAISTPVVETRKSDGNVSLKEVALYLSDLFIEANRSADDKRRKEADAYNKKVKHAPYKEGDKVYEEKFVRTKRDPKFTGRLTVRSRHSSPTGEAGTTYTCEREDGSTCRRNYEQLKRINAKFEKDLATPLAKPARKSNVASVLPAIMLTSGPPLNPTGADNRLLAH